ncbi:MAG: hypothetical protein AAGU78_03290 [Chloroflexota bacterium]|nr:hypothetical protein [Anaerolineae bacterium]
MSLLHMMLDDPRIVLALVAALAPLAMALLLGVALQVRRGMQRRAARRAHQATSALAVLGLADAPDGETVPAAASEDAPPGKTEDEAALEDEAGGVASAMQTLLDSVFTEEEAVNPLAHLLDELDDIQTADLTALCERVARQLG